MRTSPELGQPTQERVLPPKGLPMNGTMEQAMKLFAEIGMKPVNEPDVLRPAADDRMKLPESR